MSKTKQTRTGQMEVYLAGDEQPMCPKCGARVSVEQTFPDHWICECKWGCKFVFRLEWDDEGEE